ncbi:GatB/YqeY domain-containing protein [Hahella sp. SMD15-11]|uniref:GatB/YqeY domain-containing protein n=1 Tax=Thermohahella caldifontis TaxID=3142973 RepID=A0AB39URG6_9GAMM
MALKEQISDAVKDAMRARDKARLSAFRLIMADIKRVEVDSQQEADDAAVLAILDKMVKQRKDSAMQYRKAGRTDLAEIEEAEMAVIQEFMPQPLSADALAALVSDAIASTGASSMRDMGKVMAQLKPQVQGRADMTEVSKLVKSSLGG